MFKWFQSSSKRYENLLDRARNLRQPDFAELRKVFVSTTAYNPYDPDVADWRDKARSAWKNSELSTAVQLTKQILERNFLDLEAHFLLRQAMKQLDQPEQAEYHHRVLKGLFEAIGKSGDGKTPQTAFRLISADETPIVLHLLNLKLKESKRVQIDRSRFDLVVAINPQNPEPQQLFFNIDIPYRWMQKHFQ
ncbi:DUF4919 domain-containing protein [candidate division KSB1 bacterium]|nr:DUF4919 domain-containing protein [candidate division KSB1 bacterium]